jgi:hydrogenase maturation protein HypF
MTLTRFDITLTGLVQGVGFRPFVYRLASELGLAGSTQNAASHLLVTVEGDRERLEAFVRRLQTEHPPLARIESLTVHEETPRGACDFRIGVSAPGATEAVFIAPDLALCPDCRRELLDPRDRRYLYPFITCTNCGPRYSLITGVPYDRERTTMCAFPLCPDCAREYADPADRRYHAEPVACPVCGPQVTLTDLARRPLATGVEALIRARAALASGQILAIKGLGGYHLACNALDPAAVERLRVRKARDEKPFAVMAASVAVAERYCVLSPAERALLESSASPIVLARKRAEAAVPARIAPGNPDLGMMLPYTPLHVLLFHESSLELLVMTSGNLSGEPICYRDAEAAERLAAIADAILCHDREIHTRVDDSVVRVVGEGPYLLRRSRGYAPLPIPVRGVGDGPAVLACGGQLKNSFCLAQGENYYLSQHIGDLGTLETGEAYTRGIALLEELLAIAPVLVAHDLHPGYQSTEYAHSLGISCVGVQHHRAHVAACIADNALTGPVIGVAFDGTGYGDDGRIWGGEFFVGEVAGLVRIGQLESVPIPGGDSAVAEPWKTALGYLRHVCGTSTAPEALLPGVPAQHLAFVDAMLAKGVNVHHSSSVGRLFDAVAALLGVRDRVTYEGQAAIELEQIALPYLSTMPEAYYPLALTDDSCFSLSVAELLHCLVADRQAGLPSGEIAARFHLTLARLILLGCQTARARTGLERVVVSGGVFQNVTLLTRTLTLLDQDGFLAYSHRRVPPNDGGLAFGQAVIARASQMASSGRE